MYRLIRLAVLQEDEGREHLIEEFSTEAEARAWLEVNAKPMDYFPRGDYKIVEA